jgi:nucleotidyltransferase substrate binding protein (TIGR01987 family)
MTGPKGNRQGPDGSCIGMLDLTSLNNALTRFRDSLERCQNPADADDRAIVRHLRAGAIQAFSETHELAIRMLRSRVKELSSQDVERLAFADILRVGTELGLVQDARVWFDSHEKRAITSHQFNERHTDLLCGVLQDFANEVERFADKLRGFESGI